MGFEPTIPEFQSAKKVHALHHAVTVIGDDDDDENNHSIQFFIIYVLSQQL
jgi:hypothetical protein